MKIELTKEELYDAVRGGVKDAFMEMVPDWDSSKHFFRAVTEGIHSALYSVATSATHMPCADFYDSIKEGVKEAHKELAE